LALASAQTAAREPGLRELIPVKAFLCFNPRK
jgi:hypothetical protein